MDNAESAEFVFWQSLARKNSGYFDFFHNFSDFTSIGKINIHFFLTGCEATKLLFGLIEN